MLYVRRLKWVQEMTSDRPLISVVIPHLNQPDALETCLTSLDGQSLGRHLFEVIVVDNGSVSTPKEIVTAHSGTLLCEARPGPGPARNFGVKHASADIIAFIDADCRAHRDWLNNALQMVRSSPQGTIFGGDVRIWCSQGNATFTAIEAYEDVFSYRFKMFIERHGYCGTGNLVVRRSDYEKAGPFAGIELAEDVEWGQRARSAGLNFRYAPEMVVYHPARHSLRELCVKWDRHIQHDLNMLRGKPLWKIRWTSRALAILASPIVDSMKLLGSNRIQDVSTRLKAILVLFTIRAYRTRKMLSLLIASKALVWNRG
jgi:glycosyltransferase involved in cell wall biosynthesis